MAQTGHGVSEDISRLSLDHGDEQSPPPPPPNITSDGIIAFNITEKFIAAANTLSPGEVVKDGFFTLFESVGALEIMDPKMDSGCLQAEESLDEEYDVSRPLLPEEVLGIMDQLLCHELAWHIGYPLSQTLFTSVYVDAILMPTPGTIHDAHFLRSSGATLPDPMHAVLRAYCLGLLKACGHVNESIKNEHYYEEEDFVTNTYNRGLLDNFSIDAVREAINDASFVLRQLSDSVSSELIQALNARLLFRYTFLAAMDHTQYRTDAELIKGPWEETMEMLESLRSTHALAKPVPEAFSAKIQRKLASTMPPRPIVQLSFDDAFGHLTRLFKDGIEVIDVLNYTDSQCLRTFVCTFQAKKPQPLVFIRTLLQSFLFKDMEVLGSKSIRQLLDDDFAIIALPCSPLLDRANDEVEVVQDPRFVIANQMEVFRQRAAQPYLDILRTFCQNRCRVRRTLCHIIRDWENLQFDGEDIDQIIQNEMNEQPLIYRSMGSNAVESYPLPLSSWAYFYKLQQMEWIVQLGFELEVYQADELAGMYWYLNYLAKMRIQHVERIKSFTIRSLTQQRSERQQFTPTMDAQYTKSLAFIRLALLDAAVTWELADALCCLYTVLHRLSLIKPPPRPYSTDELRYELRMKPFAVIGLPALPTFEEFAAGTTQAESPTLELLRYAEKASAGAKKGFETMSKLPAAEAFSVGSHERWAATIKNGLKSCIAAGIAISAVQKALEKSGEGAELKIQAEVPTPEKAYHEWWIVPKISPVR